MWISISRAHRIEVCIRQGGGSSIPKKVIDPLLLVRGHFTRPGVLCDVSPSGNRSIRVHDDIIVFIFVGSLS